MNDTALCVNCKGFGIILGFGTGSQANADLLFKSQQKDGRLKMKNSIWIGIVAVVLIVGVVVVVSMEKSNSPETINIGAILPLSGSAAQYGKFVQSGFELARKEINKNGGISGKEFTIIYEDDQAIPKQAAAAMRKLVSINKVPIVFGSWASSSALAQAPIANETNTPMLAEAQSPKIRDAGDYVFRIQPDSRFYLKKLAPYSINELNLKRFGIFYVNNDYGKDQSEVFKDLVTGLGADVVFNEGFAQGTRDFRAALTKMKEAQPDGVFIPAYAEAGPILKQARELGINTQFLGSAPIENRDVITTAGEGAEGVIYVHHFDPDNQDKLVQDFTKKYRETYGSDAEGYAALGYDAAYVIAHVIEKVGTDKEAIKNALYEVQNLPGVAGATSFDEMGDVIKPIVIRTIKDAQFVTVQH